MFLVPIEEVAVLHFLHRNGLNVITQAHSIRQSLVTAISIHLRIVVIYRPPQLTLNKMTKSQFIDEFNE